VSERCFVNFGYLVSIRLKETAWEPWRSVWERKNLMTSINDYNFCHASDTFDKREYLHGNVYFSAELYSAPVDKAQLPDCFKE
jgi:hypothetical protein